MNRSLFLLCDDYPLAAGEFFLDDEMRVIAPKFEKIFVLTQEQPAVNLNRYIPDNLTVFTYRDTIQWLDYLWYVYLFFSPMVIPEIWFTFFRKKQPFSIRIFKIITNDIIRAAKLKRNIISILKKNRIDLKEVLFYSYWHDYKALAIAKIARKNGLDCKAIARAHRWDAFPDRHNPPYLPFKPFIIKNLTATFSISEAGKKSLERFVESVDNEKIKVSRLGKFNHRRPLLKKNTQGFIICSCSNIIPVKRVHLIVEILKHLCLSEPIKWIHFGDGPLKNELEDYAHKELPHVNTVFKGIVPNQSILDFYAENYVDLFINVSESEGIPVSIMEALSAGIPVLATDVGGSAEIVNSKNGFLVEKHFDSHNVAKIICDYFSQKDDVHYSKRLEAYLFWKKNYEAESNYSNFLNYLFSL